MSFLALCLLILSIGFVGCSSDDDAVTVPKGAEKGDLMISFKRSELMTRAIDKNASPEEQKLYNVHVFVYRADGTLERVVKLADTDFIDNQDGSYTLKETSKIEGLEAGAKNVTLGVNLPDDLVTEIQSSASAGMTSAYERTVDKLTSDTEGFVMFSNSKPVTIIADDTARPAGSFGVDRVVAKVSVKSKSGLSMNVAGGKISDITYDVQNINKVIYPVAPLVFKKETINQSIPESFKEVVAMPEGNVLDTKHTYMTEYKPVLPFAEGTYPTYVRIRCAFVPTQYIIDPAGTTSNAAYTGKKFWTLPLKDGTVAYFIDDEIAQDYFTANTELINDSEKGFAMLVSEYLDGNVDYGVFLHKTANKFDVVRNSYYIITISGINGLGEPSTTPQIDPKEKGSLVSFDLTINNWEEVESDDEQIS